MTRGTYYLSPDYSLLDSMYYHFLKCKRHFLNYYYHVQKMYYFLDNHPNF